MSENDVCIIVDKLMNLAKLKMPKEEACKYIGEIKDFIGQLSETLSQYPGTEPLYYAWEYPEYKPPYSIERRQLELEKLSWLKLDEEGRVILPWRRMKE